MFCFQTAGVFQHRRGSSTAQRAVLNPAGSVPGLTAVPAGRCSSTFDHASSPTSAALNPACSALADAPVCREGHH
jgi:hypothetical protein